MSESILRTKINFFKGELNQIKNNYIFYGQENNLPCVKDTNVY